METKFLLRINVLQKYEKNMGFNHEIYMVEY